MQITKKKFIAILPIALLVTACIPTIQDTQEKSQLDNKIKCHEFGMKNYFEEESKYKWYPEQVFAYSPDLDSCLYYYRFFTENNSGRGIVDMFSDKSLSIYMPICNKRNKCSDTLKAEDAKSFDDFMAVYNKYFE